MLTVGSSLGYEKNKSMCRIKVRTILTTKNDSKWWLAFNCRFLYRKTTISVFL